MLCRQCVYSEAVTTSGVLTRAVVMLVYTLIPHIVFRHANSIGTISAVHSISKTHEAQLSWPGG